MKKNQSMKKEVKKFYSKYPCGGEWEKGDARHELLPWMLEAFEYDKHDGELLLDVGCGTGIDLLRYTKGGAKVIGIDLSEKPLKIAKQNIKEIGDVPSLIRCDLENIPLNDGTFDMIYSNGVLHHTPNHEEGIREILRVLKPDGKSVILLYHKYSLATIITKINKFFYKLLGGRLERFLEYLMFRKMNPAEVAAFREMWEHPLIKYFTKGETRKMFNEVGFKDVQILTFDALYPLSRIIPNLNKIDVFQGLWGRFLIIKAGKG